MSLTKYQDPDPLVRGTDPRMPYQNVKDPQHCQKLLKTSLTILRTGNTNSYEQS
jgi:hypothetical protein